jgi:hypothetical protein
MSRSEARRGSGWSAFASDRTLSFPLGREGKGTLGGAFLQVDTMEARL